MMGDMRNAYIILVGKPEGKRPLRRPRQSWEDVRWILWIQGGKVWTGYIWFRMGTSSSRPL
jgi:hypothetical protein